MNNVTLTDIYEVVIAMQLDMRKMNTELKEEIKRVDLKIDNVEKNLNEEIKRVDLKIDTTEKNLKAYINKEIRETEDTIVAHLQDNYVSKQCV